MTLISRVLGFVRDQIIAGVFGASVASDAFFVAFKIPNFFRRLFAEGAFAQAFVPVFTRYRDGEDPRRIAGLVDALFGLMAVAVLATVVVGVLAAPVLVRLFAPGFMQQLAHYGLAVALLRLTFPYLFFISLTALFGSVLNTYGRFSVPAVTPALLNIAMIAAALLLAPRLDQPVMALAYGVLAGGVLQLALQFGAVLKIGLKPVPRLAFQHPGVRRILTLMAPALFGVSVGQINLLIDTLMASFLQTGSISWLYYSDRLVEFPLGLFGVALGTVILPHLARHHADGPTAHFSATLDWALRLVVLVTLPASVGLAVLAVPLVSTLFQYGTLTPHDVTMAARSLIAYASGLTGFMMIKILAPGFYARQDLRTPVKAATIAMLVNLVLNVALMFPLAHAGLALATSLSAGLNAALLLCALYRDGSYRPAAGWSRFLLQVLGATIVMAGVVWLAAGDTGAWLVRQAVDRALRLGLVLAAGGLAYGAALWGLGLRFERMAQPAGQV